MTRKMKIFIGLLVLGLAMVAGGLWFLFNSLVVDNADKLAGSQWKLVSINDSGLVEDMYISLYFHNDGSFWGYSGCNTYEGSYSANASDMRISDGSATEIGCDEAINRQGKTFQNYLWNAASYSIENNYLKIYDPTNQQPLVFEKIPELTMDPADLAGTSWQLEKINGVTITENQSATLVFYDSGNSGGGSFKGYSGSYDYDFSYEAYGDSIKVTGESGYRTALIPRELRQDAGSYFPGMRLVGNYRLTSDELELYTAREETMVFKPYEFSFGSATGSGGRIAFLSRGERNFNDIYSMNPDGSDLVKLARWVPSQMPYRNIWSADGKTLAYVEYEEDTQRTWLSVVDSNGQNRRRVLETTDLKLDSMALSPDGRTIVISLDSTRVTRIETPMGNTVHVEIIREKDMDLFTVDVETGELKRLTDTTDVMEKFPSYSPDGRQISFVGRIDTETERNVPRDVFIMDADGGNRRLLAHHADADAIFVFNPDIRWSPDGSKIAYALYNMSISDSEHFADIFVIDVKEGSLTNLTNSPYVTDSEPAWSPDGSKIALVSGNRTEGFRTLIMDISDESVIEMDRTWPSWTPDGEGLIFTNSLNAFELMVIDADGKNPRTLAVTDGVRISNPVWLAERWGGSHLGVLFNRAPNLL